MNRNTRILIIVLLIIMIIATLALEWSKVEASTEPGEFTCDLVAYHVGSDGTIYRLFECNWIEATHTDVCVLWRTTHTYEGSTDGVTISSWYMCNLFSVYMPVIIN